MTNFKARLNYYIDQAPTWMKVADGVVVAAIVFGVIVILS